MSSRWSWIVLFVLIAVPERLSAYDKVMGYPPSLDHVVLSTIKKSFAAPSSPPLVETPLLVSPAVLVVPEKPERPKRQEPMHFYLKNGDPEKIKTALKDLFPELSIASEPRTRSIVCVGDSVKLSQVKSILYKLDSSAPIVKFEIKIVEISSADFQNYSALFSSLTNGFKVSFDTQANKVVLPAQFDAILSQLIDTGTAKLLARPVILSLDNNKALIKVGEQIPYLTTIVKDSFQSIQVNYLDTGIEVSLLPLVSGKDRINTLISVQITSVKLWKEFGDKKFPVLSTRRTETLLGLENKKTVVIAGLLDEQERENQTAVPFFADLPFIGQWFRGKQIEKSQSDILFIITPQLL